MLFPSRSCRCAFWAGGATLILMAVVQLKTRHLLLADRFLAGAGWGEVVLAAGYAAFLCYKMSDPRTRSRWRRYSWAAFTLVFFSQLLLGLWVDPVFLLSGDLHVPVPMVMIGGAVYRMEFGFMPILLLATLLLSGPAWCSHLCYFGGADNWAAAGGRPLRVRFPAVRYILLVLLALGAVVARMCGVSPRLVTLFAIGFGVAGLLVVLFFSRRKHSMVHCTRCCPVGALVSVAKYFSPFRYVITADCVRCGACVSRCRYGALSAGQIRKGRPGISCTYCGDCLPACGKQALRYRFFGLSAAAAEDLWLITTVSLHACFLFIARV